MAKKKTQKRKEKAEGKKENLETKKEKGEQKEQAEEKKKEKTDRNKQTEIAVIIMVVLIASVLVAHWIVQKSKTFEYEGIKFYKYKEDNILSYKSELMNYSRTTGRSVGPNSIPFTLVLKDDPRELRKIPVDGAILLDQQKDVILSISPDGTVRSNQQKDVILSVSPELIKCNATHRTLMDYAWTLGNFGFNVSLATPEKAYAKENNMSFVTCSNNSKGRNVILMREGNETKITQKGNCCVMEISNCEVQESFGRFILEFIVNSVKTAEEE